jgi:steroid 5-alpha reductase family enzyme
LWSLRLSIYLSLRNWNKAEDHRYQAIRANNSPGFGFKSVYIVFGLQATLAWIVALPLFVGLSARSSLNGLDMVAAGLILLGLSLESLADHQLARFKADPANRGKVLDRGLWRYSRHPNYFGEACVWWGFWLLAMAGAGWAGIWAVGWTVISPLLMTFLLLRISGVALLEKDIADRRPEYRAYIARTSAFVPLPPRPALSKERQA